jgi:hypothetical protein
MLQLCQGHVCRPAVCCAALPSVAVRGSCILLSGAHHGVAHAVCCSPVLQLQIRGQHLRQRQGSGGGWPDTRGQAAATVAVHTCLSGGCTQHQQPAARHMPHGPSPAHPSPPPTNPPSPAQPTLTAWSSGCMFLMCFCRPKRKECQAARKASLMQLASSAAYWSRWGHSSSWHTRSTSSTDPTQQAQQAQQAHQAQQMRHELRHTRASMAASAMGWAAPGTQAGEAATHCSQPTAETASSSGRQ